MLDLGRHEILGVRVSGVDYDAAVDKIRIAAQEKRAFGVSALAVHGLMTGALDRQQRFRLNRLDMLVPDGQPVRWALGWLHRKRLPDRVYGPNLTLRVCEMAAREKLPVFFMGSDADMLAALTARLEARYPDLVIAGCRPSRFRTLSDAERAEEIGEIKASGAAILFVGLGCPRQEVWVYEHLEDLPMPMIAVGAAFAFHAGKLAQAPEWWQKRGLEWLYRLIREPRRLWRRYVFLNPLYLAMIGLQRIGLAPVRAAGAAAPDGMVRYG